MRLFIKLFFFSILGSFLISCNNKEEQKNNCSQIISSANLSYAKGFAIDYYKNYKCVLVYNPWRKGEILERYYLVSNKNIITPSNGHKIIIPLKTIAVNSCSHFEFLNLIGELDKVVGISSPERVYNKYLLDKYKVGNLVNIGDAFSMNIEKIMMLKPSAIMISGYNQTDESTNRLKSSNISVITNNEWTETNILGRAEWIKFVAAFYNKEQLADSIFHNVATHYEKLKDSVTHITKKPSILSGMSFKGTWYLPGGRSFMGKLYADAGSDYYFANDTTSESLPISLEIALKKLRYCEIWLGTNVKTMKELEVLDSRLLLFEAAKNHRVYNYNKRTTPSGGNDFWETAVARPDILLKDVIKVLHPELFPDYETFYIDQLK